MLARLQRYAELRGGEVSPGHAAREVGVSAKVGEAYERWYRRECLHLPDRPARGFGAREK
jgi:hypothetical protein